MQLLILDDWGLEPLDAAARHDLLEILEKRDTRFRLYADARHSLGLLRAAGAYPCFSFL